MSTIHTDRLAKSNVALATMLFDVRIVYVYVVNNRPYRQTEVKSTKKERNLCIREGARMLQTNKTLSYSISTEKYSESSVVIAWFDGERYRSFLLYTRYLPDMPFLSDRHDISIPLRILKRFYSTCDDFQMKNFPNVTSISIDDAVQLVVDCLTKLELL